MKIPLTLRLVFAVFLCAVAVTAVTAAAPMDTGFSYQGRLYDGGVPAGGLYDLRFVLRDQPVEGVQIGTEVALDAVVVTNGLFQVTLNFGTNVFDGTALWLDVSVRNAGSQGTFTLLTPSQKIQPVPYTIHAIKAGQLVGILPGNQLEGSYSNAVSLQNAGNAFAGSGAGLRNLNGTEITTGTVADGRIAATLARDSELLSVSNSLSGQISSEASGLAAALTVTSNGLSGRLEGTNASLVTRLVGVSNVLQTAIGDEAAARTALATQLTTGDNVFSGSNVFTGFVIISNQASLLFGNGAGLTNLDGSMLSLGTIPDERISSAIARVVSVLGLSNQFNQVTATLFSSNALLAGAITATTNGLSARLVATNTALVTLVTESSNALSGELAATNTALVGLINSSSNTLQTAIDAEGTARAALSTQLLSGNNTFGGSNSFTGENVFSGSNHFSGVLTLTNAANMVAGDGSALTALNGTQITSGTVADARIAATLTRDSELLSASNSLSGQLSSQGTALSGTITATTNGLSARLEATNTALVTLVTDSSNALSGELAATNTALVGLINSSSNTLQTAIDAEGTARAALSTQLLSGNNTFSGSNSFTGENVFSGSNHFSGVMTLTNTNNAIYGVFTGNGVSLTNLNGSAIANGVVGEAYIDSALARVADVTSDLTTTSNALSGALAATNAALVTLINSSSNVLRTDLDSLDTSFASDLVTTSNALSGELAATNTALVGLINSSSNTLQTAIDAEGTARAALSTQLLSGNNTFSGSNSFTGENVFSGSNHFSGIMTLTNAANQIVGTFSGDGDLLTNLSGSAIAKGVVGEAYIDSAVARVADVTSDLTTTSNALSGGLAATNAALVTLINSSSNVLRTDLDSLDTSFAGDLVTTSNALSGELAATNTALVGLINSSSNSLQTAVNDEATARTALSTQLLSGNNTFSGSNSFTGENVFSGSNHFSGVMTLTNTNNAIYGVFTGNGVSLTNLNGSAIANGVVGEAYIDSALARVADVTSDLTTTSNALSGGLAATNAALVTLINSSSNVLRTDLDSLDTSFASDLVTTSNALSGELAATNTALVGLINSSSNTLQTAIDAEGTARAALSTQLLSGNNTFAGSNSFTGENVFSGSNHFSGILTLTNAANQVAGSFSGDGDLLTNLSGSAITKGVVGEAYIDSAVARVADVTSDLTTTSNALSGELAATNAALVTLINSSSNVLRTDLDSLDTSFASDLVTTSNALSGELAATNTALVGLINSSSNTLQTAIDAEGTARAALSTQLLSGNNTFSGTNTFTGSNHISGIMTLTNSANQIVGTFSGDGSGLTGIPVSLLTGVLLSSQFSGTYGQAVTLNGDNIHGGANRFSGAVTLTNSANTIAGDGSALISLNAGALASGSIDDARLSSNVALTTNSVAFAGTVGGTALNIGSGNSLSGTGSSIAGGLGNSIDALSTNSFVGGGTNNVIGSSGGLSSSESSLIVGGTDNTVTNAGYSVIVGGGGSTVTEDSYFGFIGGGLGQKIDLGQYGVIVGGRSNTAGGEGIYNFVGGGDHNTSWNSGSAVVGGRTNYAGGTDAFIGGGRKNTTAAGWAVVAGGYENTVSDQYTFIGGGISNKVNGQYGVIPGGFSNLVSGIYGLAAGRRAQAVHSGAFVWADGTDADFASTAANTFNVRANGGINFVSSGSVQINGSDIQTTATSVSSTGDNTFSGTNAFTGSNHYSGMLVATNAENIVAGDGSSLTGLWKTGGNSSTSPESDYLGTADSQPLIFKVNAARAARFEAGDKGAPNTILGSATNYVPSGVKGAVIGGGGALADNGDFVPEPNQVHADFGIIGGGKGNIVNSGAEFAVIAGGVENAVAANAAYSVIAGGIGNAVQSIATNSVIGGGIFNEIGANADSAVIGGGFGNAVTNAYATVPGGADNQAGGQYSFAAGRRALADADGAFVWADSQNADFQTTTADTFNIRAQGGVNIQASSANFEFTGGLLRYNGSEVMTNGATTATFGAGSLTVGTTQLVTTATGVGIGTASPSERLDVDGIAKAGAFMGGTANTLAGANSSITGGSTNLINIYATNAFIGGGMNNAVGGDGTSYYGNLSVIVGGEYNSITNSQDAFIGGGGMNSIDQGADGSVIVGGFGNTVPQDNYLDFIGGGQGNYFGLADYSSIVGGLSNSFGAESSYGFVGGGAYNSGSSSGTFLGAGRTNTVGGTDSFLGAGGRNTVSSSYSGLVGGQGNSLSGTHSFIGGGELNALATTANRSAIVGGSENGITNADYSFIGGGRSNVVTGTYATIPGGAQNEASGNYSFAAGHRAKAANVGSFVWADSTDADFTSSDDNTFSVRANGGIELTSSAFFTYNGYSVVVDKSSATSASPTGTTIGAEGGSGNDIAGAALTLAGGIGTGTGGGGDIIFKTAPAAMINPPDATPNTLAEVMRISKDGQVGIGTSSPTATLEVNGTFKGGSSTTNSSSFAFIGGGSDNSIGSSADYSVITGGEGNTIPDDSDHNFIGGGQGNYIDLASSGVVVGGVSNSFGGEASFGFVGGGTHNTVWNSGGVVVGGRTNYAQGTDPFIGGGRNNNVSASYAALGGGLNNSLNSTYSFVGAGLNNTVSDTYGTIAGGNANTVASGAGGSAVVGGSVNFIGSSANHSFIGGGEANTNNAWYTAVAGGRNNAIDQAYAFVGGGSYNQNSSYHGVLTGGQSNTLSGGQSIIGGGLQNSVAANYVTLSGGVGNTVAGSSHGSVLAGGSTNSVSGTNSFIGGGALNSLATTANYSVIGGGSANGITDADYSFIAGGSLNTIGSGTTWGVIGGGGQNHITNGFYYSISGGSFNSIGGNADQGSTIAGGSDNTIVNASYSFIAGGRLNSVTADDSFAAGRQAQVTHSGSFVWADGTAATMASSANNQFTVRASGGARIFSNSGATAGVTLDSGGTSWSAVSDRNAKKDFTPIDEQEVLRKLAEMPVQSWRYKWDGADATPHIGPVAQDFKAAFYPGRDDKSITTLEFDGVELAAIKGLNQKLEEKEREIGSLRDELAQLRAMVMEMRNNGAQ